MIQIEGVTFGYASKDEAKNPSLPLFADVHLGIEQSSRIALVGPNGSGKVGVSGYAESVHFTPPSCWFHSSQRSIAPVVS